MKLLSIAIPCYNSAAYMENCIRSLLPGGDEVEILIVDDGSQKDNTGEIADRYEREYPGICRAIHQENGGHGAAVNAGLREATGIFFKVVDSDDWVNKQAYEQVLNTLRRFVYGKDTLDMLITNFVYEKQGAKHKKVMNYNTALPKNEVFTWDDVKVFIAGQYILMHSVIYRTELLRDCGLELPMHTFYVDNIFVYEPLPHVRKMYYLDVNFYRYFIGRSDQSVNEQVMIGRIDQQILVTKIIADAMVEYMKKPMNGKLRKYMINYVDIMMTVSSVLLLKSGTEENLEKKKEMFAPAMYAVIKGEALGLRAFLHFDLLRLFGWGDLEKSPENLDRLCLPYVSEYSRELQKQLTVGEALEKVIADLQESMELLNDNDPFGLTPKPDDYDLPNEDKFFEDRHKRFNYWAAVCTLTRVYMWMGNKAEALPLAELFVKEGGETSWISSYVIDAYDPADRDLTFTTEHVFALDVTKLFENMQYYMNPKANDPNENTDLLYHAKARASGLFESTDYRLARWYDQTGNEHYDGWAFVKFWEVEKYKYGSTMPLIRKSEMYYIAAECLLATGKDADRLLAIERLNTVREKRGMSGLGNDLTVVSVQNEITKEYQREFINEGQLFYYYKRLGFEKIPYATKAATDAVYVVPLPTWDVDLGGMEDYKK